MRRTLILAASFLAPWLFTVPAAAQTPEERAQLERIFDRGRLIYALDRAAWVATDDILSKVPNPAGAGIRGYIVERDREALAVIFYGGDREAPVAFYRARVENGRVVSSQVYPANARPPLTPVQRRMSTVRALAGSLGFSPCQASFNTVVIPPDAPDAPIDLYLLTPQLSRDEWPAGGHFRVTFDADGRVAGSRAFTNSCINLGGPQRAAALVITHLLDPLPTEIHVFTALGSGLPLLVATVETRRTWEVDRRGIGLVEGAAPGGG